MNGIDTNNKNIQKDVVPVMEFHEKLIKGENLITDDVSFILNNI